MAKPFSALFLVKKGGGSRAAPLSLSAESESPLHRALRIGREQPDSKLFAPEGHALLEVRRKETRSKNVWRQVCLIKSIFLPLASYILLLKGEGCPLFRVELFFFKPLWLDVRALNLNLFNIASLGGFPIAPIPLRVHNY